MISYVTGSGDVISGREKEIARLFVSSMPESILARLGEDVAFLYFKEVSRGASVKITLAIDGSQKVIGYVDIIDENIFSQVLKKYPIYIGFKILQRLLVRKIKLSQLFSSDKTKKTNNEDRIKSLPELSYIFTDPDYKGAGVGKQLLSAMRKEYKGLEFYTKTLESNKHVVRMYEYACSDVVTDFFYEDRVNRYIIVFVVL